MTKGEGLNNKPQKDSAGSFGLGKFASFLASSLRTVLYATAFNENGHIRHRFLGKTILVSHKDKNGKYYRRTGYLGKGFHSLKNDEVPDSFKLSEPGTAIYIPGYSFTKEWEKESTAIVLENYFHAIIQRELEVKIRGRLINRKTHSRYLREIDWERPIHNFAKLSLADPIDQKFVPDVGNISVRIKIDKENKRRDIALVRDAGMLITTDRKRMFRKLGSLPRFWWGFTVIIECKSDGQALLRQAESPRHDQISVDFIGDEKLRVTAKKLFDDIGNWCYEIIKEFAEPESGEDSENIAELSEYLGLEGSHLTDTGEETPDSQGKPVVTDPIQSHRAPRRPKKPRKKKSSGEDMVDVPDTGGDPVNGERKGNKGGNGGIKVKPRPQRFTGVRFRKGSHDTHSFIVTFDQPEESPKRIDVYSIGEDGASYPVPISNAATRDMRIRVENNSLLDLPVIEPDARQEIEITSSSPVTDKTFSILFFEDEAPDEV